jgi:hypothetical protein
MKWAPSIQTHYQVTTTWGRYIYGRVGHIQKAVGIFEEVVKVRRKFLGPEHPSTLASMHNLAVMYREMTWHSNRRLRTMSVLDYLHEARTLLRKTSEGYKKILGLEHSNTLGSMLALARVYEKLGVSSEARELRRIVRTHLYGRIESQEPEDNRISPLLFAGTSPRETRYVTHSCYDGLKSHIRGLKDY